MKLTLDCLYFAATLLPLFAAQSVGETVESIQLEETEKNNKSDEKSHCVICQESVDGFINLARSGSSKSMIRSSLYKFCIMYADNMYPDWGEESCSSAADYFFDLIQYILSNKQDINGERVCAIFLQPLGCVDRNQSDWSIDIPPKPNEDHYFVENGVQLPSTLKILHLTDIHFDPDYLPGSNANCSLPLCCRNDSGPPSSPEDAAGYWGDYRKCDMPWHSVLNLMDQIKNEHKQINYIYYTGDIIGHKEWILSRESNTDEIKRLFELFKTTFGTVPVFPILGNHEGYPPHCYAPQSVKESKLSSQWIFNLIDSEWSKWLPKPASETILVGGFYTVLVKKGFRIVALNSNVCYTMNLWLFYEDIDPYGQLSWLVKVLLAAEKNGEYVHIISHIPPGDTQCHKIWNREFIRIVKRFSKTIQAQFNGHTHMDEIRIFMDEENPRKVYNVAYNAASFATYTGFNPNYRIYDVNSLDYEVTNYEEWIFNITEANLSPKIQPRWYKLYSFAEDYNLGFINRQKLGSLANNLFNNDTLKYQYYRYLIRDSDDRLPQGSNETYITSFVCGITNILIEDSLKCYL